MFDVWGWFILSDAKYNIANEIKFNHIYFAQIYINNNNYASYTLSRTARLNKWQ